MADAFLSHLECFFTCVCEQFRDCLKLSFLFLTELWMTYWRALQNWNFIVLLYSRNHLFYFKAALSSLFSASVATLCHMNPANCYVSGVIAFTCWQVIHAHHQQATGKYSGDTAGLSVVSPEYLLHGGQQCRLLWLSRTAHFFSLKNLIFIKDGQSTTVTVCWRILEHPWVCWSIDDGPL